MLPALGRPLFQLRFSPAVVAEFQRHSLQKGAWTKLLTPPSAWLKEHNLLEPESELPGDFEFSAHPVAEAFARVPLFKVRWRRKYKHRMHINVAELAAYFARRGQNRGQGSGPCASPILNRKLRASLGPRVTFSCLQL